jgi:hypothetical protein
MSLQPAIIGEFLDYYLEIAITFRAEKIHGVLLKNGKLDKEIRNYTSGTT